MYAKFEFNLCDFSEVNLSFLFYLNPGYCHNNSEQKIDLQLQERVCCIYVSFG